MSSLQQIFSLVNSAPQFTSRLTRPSRLPEIVSMILSNKRQKEALAQQANETSMKQGIAQQEMMQRASETGMKNALGEQQLVQEAEKIQAGKQGQILDAISRIIASGEDVPENLAGLLNGEGSLGNIYTPPDTKDSIAKQIILSKTPEDVDKVINDNPKLTRRQLELAYRQKATLSSPSHEPEATLEDIDAVKKGQKPPSGASVQKALQAANSQELVSGARREQEKQDRRELAKEARAEADKDTALRQMQEAEKLGRSDLFLDAFNNLSEIDKSEYIQSGGGPRVQGHRSNFTTKQEQILSDKNQRTLDNLDKFTQAASGYNLHGSDPNKFYSVYEDVRKDVSLKDLDGFSYKNISKDTKDKAISLVNKLQRFSEIEGRVNPSTIPMDVKIIPKRMGFSEATGYNEIPASLEISGRTRQVRPEVAQKYWDDLKERIRKEMD